MRKLLETNEMIFALLKESERVRKNMQFAHPALSSLGTRKREASASRIGIKVRKLKKMLGLRFAVNARFAQRKQLDWELRVKR